MNVIVKRVITKDYLTKSNLPASDYVINPYVGCPHACKYCYANHSFSNVRNNIRSHDLGSPLLYGNIGPDDIIKDRVMESCKTDQLGFF